MNLSAKEFARVVARFERTGGKAVGFGGEDKRRADRVPLRHRATIVPHADGAPGEGVGVEVRDFSPRGLRFLHPKPLRRGEQFVLELPQRGSAPVNILCTVAHCRPTPEGPFSTGAEFTLVLRAAKPSAHVPPLAPARSSAAAGTSAAREERDRIRRSILD